MIERRGDRGKKDQASGSGEPAKKLALNEQAKARRLRERAKMRALKPTPARPPAAVAQAKTATAKTPRPGRSLVAALRGVLERLRQRLALGWRRRESERQLKLCESVSLGEKRFVALIEVGPQRFLIGGTPQALTMLGKLRPAPSDFAQWYGSQDRQVM